MPLYLDVHDRDHQTPGEELPSGHQRGLDIQVRHGAKYLKCWHDDQKGAVVYLLAAPTLETARVVHRDAHGAGREQLVELEESALWRSTPRATTVARRAGQVEGGGRSRRTDRVGMGDLGQGLAGVASQPGGGAVGGS